MNSISQSLEKHNIFAKNIHRNLPPHALVRKALDASEVTTHKSGAVVVYTGKYTGRSPKDKFIVDSPEVHDEIDWGKVNAPMSEENFEKLYKKMTDYMSARQNLYIYDGFAGADEKYKLHVRVVSEYAYQSLFIQHLLRRPTPEELKTHTPALTVLCAPNCHADPAVDGTNSEVFIVLNLSKMIILIGGTKYAGEMKKSIFSAMNYLLPKRHVLPMHSSANIGKDGDTAIFFGLSGTGKTTLSADPDRMLIGDDEHGWSEKGIFNFEGGCYAKCINLKRAHEPLIWDAIRDGALLENVVIKPDGEFDFSDKSLTENTRVAYPLDYIENSVMSGIGGQPETVIFLTADASGVLPPVARLSSEAAAYHFLSGYTSKLAGTERGVIEPKPTFSAYFGAPFMPLKPHVYAELLMYYVNKCKSNVFLINTGWIGGGYGVGKRISINDTRKIVTAALTGKLNSVKYIHNALFNLEVPESVPGIDSKLLNPRSLWKDSMAYDKKADEIAGLFIQNFKRFDDGAMEEIKKAGPRV